MFSSDRDTLRTIFFESFKKYREKLALEPLEAEVVEIILLHPEYHELLQHPEKFHTKDFDETNPFLHLSLHLAIREQINTNRPTGIQDIYQKLNQKYQDLHVVEHHLMEQLAQIIWHAQKTGGMPDEKEYLLSCQRVMPA